MTKYIALGLAILCSATLLSAQQPASSGKLGVAYRDNDNSILMAESSNLKSDLAELRSMLNVMASQESTTDYRTHALMQTNRQMWQVVIARLAELTQRLDALEQQGNRSAADTRPAASPKP